MNLELGAHFLPYCATRHLHIYGRERTIDLIWFTLFAAVPVNVHLLDASNTDISDRELDPYIAVIQNCKVSSTRLVCIKIQLLHCFVSK